MAKKCVLSVLSPVWSLRAGPPEAVFQKKVRRKSYKRYNSLFVFRRVFIFRCRFLPFFRWSSAMALHLMRRRGRRPIGGLGAPVPERMEDTAESSYLIVKHQLALALRLHHCEAASAEDAS